MLRSAATSLTLTLVLAAAPAAAQVPGYQQLDTRQIMAEYHAEVLTGVNQVMDRWGRAWERDDVEEVLDLYWDNATLIPPTGPPLRGQDAIRGYLEASFPGQGAVEAFMLDFDASGGMAVVSGNYTLQAGGSQSTGSLTTVYLQRGRTWRIRAQVFTPSAG